LDYKPVSFSNFSKSRAKSGSQAPSLNPFPRRFGQPAAETVLKRADKNVVSLLDMDPKCVSNFCWGRCCFYQPSRRKVMPPDPLRFQSLVELGITAARTFQVESDYQYMIWRVISAHLGGSRVCEDSWVGAPAGSVSNSEGFNSLPASPTVPTCLSRIFAMHRLNWPRWRHQRIPK
jgi:hypothetical protein